MTSTVEEISRATGVREEKVGEALDIIHGFDPAGVGARDLSECLQLQLAARKELTPQMEEIITHHLEDIANNRLSAVARDTGMTVLQVQEAADVIRTLEPKPGRQFASQMETKYVIPDVIVEKIDNEYVVIINESSTPHLTISSYYKSLLGKAEKDQQLADYLSERVSSANWLIKSIEQRKQTIYNVVSAVVKYQKDFFDLGSKHLRTLTLKDIAEELGIHESTVSRSISGKYLQCPRGVYEIKYFFSAGVSDQVGEGVSSNSIKEFIKEIVEGEDRHKPYSDQAMVSILKDKGFNISRRTVAKYRDELGILSSSKRKRY
jgi:RNA polymerase sigma-54 factor